MAKTFQSGLRGGVQIVSENNRSVRTVFDRWISMRANLVCFRAGIECRSMSRMLRLPQA
jgi:hypothetical protein